MTHEKAMINRLKTSIRGLDQILGGGLPEFSLNLIAGTPGSGKTILAHQLMFGMATPERSALYFTALGEAPLKMLRYQQQFDFFDNAGINTSVRFVSLGEDAATGDLDKVLSRISSEMDAHAPSLVFLDSFRSVILSSQETGTSHIGLQRFIQDLGTLMANSQATTFLIGEYFDEAESSPVFTIADGVIWLRQSIDRNSVVRKIEISKMRGQPTLSGLHTFRIGSSGIRVFAPPEPQSALTAPQSLQRSRARTGIAGLDEMMGGGLPRGYSLLVAGPSGSGKSILAAAFLAEGARLGETGVIAAFEQRSGQPRARAIAALIDDGRIGVVDTAHSTLSVDEISTEIIEEIQRLKASRVVIDSLSGFELAIAPTFQHDFRESLARMVSALANLGVSVLMTSELEDRYGELSFSPYGTAFLTDSIVVHRYVEIDSRLERVMAVVKMRACAHSNDLRLYQIDDSGIIVGKRLAGYKGLLSGSPARADTSDRPMAGVEDA